MLRTGVRLPRAVDPGKPWQNGTAESFNGKFRDECLSLEWFRSRVEAKVVIENWRRHFNEVRPHSSLGYLTPATFAAKVGINDVAPVQATGAERCGIWSLRAPPRRPTALQGASKGSNRGSRLKLSMVRRNWAGHWLNRNRRLAKDFEATIESAQKLARNYLASVCLAAALVWWI